MKSCQVCIFAINWFMVNACGNTITASIENSYSNKKNNVNYKQQTTEKKAIIIIMIALTAKKLSRALAAESETSKLMRAVKSEQPQQ